MSNECEHGQLARSCNICEYEEEIAELTAKLEKAEADAARYRFLRDEDNWGEDSGDDSWEMLGESHGEMFDGIVDSRMKALEGEI
jgi:hypothetical protein